MGLHRHMLRSPRASSDVARSRPHTAPRPAGVPPPPLGPEKKRFQKNVATFCKILMKMTKMLKNVITFLKMLQHFKRFDDWKTKNIHLDMLGGHRLSYVFVSEINY
jgi:hypothetical protein